MPAACAGDAAASSPSSWHAAAVPASPRRDAGLPASGCSQAASAAGDAAAACMATAPPAPRPGRPGHSAGRRAGGDDDTDSHRSVGRPPAGCARAAPRPWQGDHGCSSGRLQKISPSASAGAAQRLRHSAPECSGAPGPAGVPAQRPCRGAAGPAGLLARAAPHAGGGAGVRAHGGFRTGAGLSSGQPNSPSESSPSPGSRMPDQSGRLTGVQQPGNQALAPLMPAPSMPRPPPQLGGRCVRSSGLAPCACSRPANAHDGDSSSSGAAAHSRRGCAAAIRSERAPGNASSSAGSLSGRPAAHAHELPHMQASRAPARPGVPASSLGSHGSCSSVACAPASGQAPSRLSEPLPAAGGPPASGQAPSRVSDPLPSHVADCCGASQPAGGAGAQHGMPQALSETAGASAGLARPSARSAGPPACRLSASGAHLGAGGAARECMNGLRVKGALRPTKSLLSRCARAARSPPARLLSCRAGHAARVQGQPRAAASTACMVLRGSGASAAGAKDTCGARARTHQTGMRMRGSAAHRRSSGPGAGASHSGACSPGASASPRTATSSAPAAPGQSCSGDRHCG